MYEQTSDHRLTRESPLEYLDLSARAFGCLHRAGKRTLGDIADMTEAELFRLRNMSRQCGDEVTDKMAAVGIPLKK